jgi:hypothetical protein
VRRPVQKTTVTVMMCPRSASPFEASRTRASVNSGLIR